MGFPGESDGKESACNAGDPGSVPELGRSPGEEWLPTPVYLPGEFHGQRSLVGYSSWGHKDLDMTEQLTLSFLNCLDNSEFRNNPKGMEWAEVSRVLK